jgi:hypothetical protein
VLEESNNSSSGNSTSSSASSETSLSPKLLTSSASQSLDLGVAGPSSSSYHPDRVLTDKMLDENSMNGASSSSTYDMNGHKSGNLSPITLPQYSNNCPEPDLFCLNARFFSEIFFFPSPHTSL